MSTGDAATVRQVLKTLDLRTRQRLLAECMASAFDALPEAEQKAIRSMQRALSDQIRNMGDKTTLEILAAVGRLWQNGDHGLNPYPPAGDESR